MLKIYEDDNLIENAAAMGKYMEAQVEKLKQKHKSIGDFRNTGLLGCIELVKSRTTKEPLAPFNAKPDEVPDENGMKITTKRSKNWECIQFVAKVELYFVALPLIVIKEQINGMEIINEAISIANRILNPKGDFAEP
jgi:taurine--2-oxoglutarate transaminase